IGGLLADDQSPLRVQRFGVTIRVTEERATAAVQHLTALDARLLSALRALAELLMLHLGRVAAHKADELTLGGIVQRLGDEADRPGWWAWERIRPRWRGSGDRRSIA